MNKIFWLGPNRTRMFYGQGLQTNQMVHEAGHHSPNKFSQVLLFYGVTISMQIGQRYW